MVRESIAPRGADSQFSPFFASRLHRAAARMPGRARAEPQLRIPYSEVLHGTTVSRSAREARLSAAATRRVRPDAARSPVLRA
jgi:hypothetical protein